MKILCLFVLVLLSRVNAQNENVCDQIAAEQKIHAEIVEALIREDIGADSALNRLQISTIVNRSSAESLVDLAYASMDLGNRLIAADRPHIAEFFFKVTARNLTAFLEQHPDALPDQKAQYLQTLSYLESTYLGDSQKARENIEKAISLNPSNGELQIVRKNQQ